MKCHLEKFLQDMLSIYGIKAREFILGTSDIYSIDMRLRKDILCAPDTVFEKIKYALSELESDTILHFTDVFQCNYYIGWIKERDDSFWLLGPIVFEKITGVRFDEMFSGLKISETLRLSLQNYYYQVFYCPIGSMFNSMLTLMSDYYYGKGNYRIIHKDDNALLTWKSFYEGYYRIPDDPFKNVKYIEIRYGYENSMIRAVQSGNEQEALEQYSKLEAILIPARLSNGLRDTKDLSITLNTLLRKAIELSSVHPIHIDNLSNSNIRQIEQNTSIDQCRVFQRKMIRNYCNLVKKYNLQNYSFLIREVLTYIHTNFTVDLSLKVLSEQFHVNASYLSSLFKKEVGISITEYTNTYRINYAQALLCSTDLPIKSIALQCGISDICYFSRMFKRIVGITPKAYRDKNWSYVKT